MNATLEVLHCDNHLLAVNKPAGVPSVPDDSGDPSLLEIAKQWIKLEYDKPGAVFLGVVHRLDRPVSGVVLFARTSKAAERVARQFRERETEKTYWGLVQGAPRETSGEIEHWLWKDREHNRVHIANAERKDAKLAQTLYRVLGAGPASTWLELNPHSGRSHQLRVACASLGTPLLGDLKYGAERPLEDRSIALHARRLCLEHPTLKEPITFEAAPPKLAVWRKRQG